ncbi:MAG TPA: hypothetical protein PKC43_14415 [Phycisphaerales bacterium]|nr:hypothetical protein [Phycisphaerales bacterium]HMP38628.1 hypothetical protein [Phycisphaerales bacterium]
MLCEDQTGGAGSLPATALRAVGSGPLAEINGSLNVIVPFGNPGSGLDPEDMYLIQIIDPAGFSATTVSPTMGSLVFPTALWLFEPCGTGLLGNVSTPQAPKTGFSLLLPEPSDGVGPGLQKSGVYYLAISGAARQPASQAGAIFNFASAAEISGPDGAGARFPVTEWIDAPAFGDYTIILTGAAFLGVFATGCAADLDGNGVVDGADLGILLSSWGPCTPALCADLDGNGVVNGADLGVLLAAWGVCGTFGGTPCGDPGSGACAEANGTPGCEDPCCCTAVCAVRPECCLVIWDSDCVAAGSLLCP